MSVINLDRPLRRSSLIYRPGRKEHQRHESAMPGGGGPEPEAVVSNAEFIQAVFRKPPAGAYPWVTGFAEPPLPDASWRGQAVTNGLPWSIKQPQHNNFFVISSLNSGAEGNGARTADNFAACHVIVLDDVGTKVEADRLKLPSSYSLETSPGNFQVGYLLDTPATEQAKVERLLDALGDDGLTDSGAKGVIRYCRLPVGVNSKPKYVELLGEPFPHRLHNWNPELTYTVESIGEAYGLDLTPPKAAPYTPRTESPAWANEVLPKLSERGLYKRPKRSKPDVHHVTCPWYKDHTDEADSGAVYFEPSAKNDWIGGFVCQHRCKGVRKIRDLADFLGIDTGPVWVAELNAKFFVARDGGKTVVCSERLDPVMNRSRLEHQSCHSIREFYQNRKVEVATDSKGNPVLQAMGSAWLAHAQRRQYEGIVMSPREECPGYYNLWQGFSVEPREGDWSLMQEHILKNICRGDRTLYDYLLRWKAFAVQYPDRPGQVAIVLRGPRGAGKGVYVTTFGSLFGRHSIHIRSSKHLVGNFNSHLRDCVFLFADEAVFAGDRAGEKVLNGLITEDTLFIEGKGKDAITVKNLLHIMMASNSDYIVPAGAFERRYCVLDVGAEHMQDHKYFARVVDQMNNGGSAAMLHDLLALDLTGFNIWNYPKTEALSEQQDYHLDVYTSFCRGILWEGEIMGAEDNTPFAVSLETEAPTKVSTEFMLNAFRRSAGGAKLAHETGQAPQLGKALARVGVKKTRPRAGNEGKGTWPRQHHYLLPGLAEMRARYEDDQKRTITWPVIEEEGQGPEPSDLAAHVAKGVF